MASATETDAKVDTATAINRALLLLGKKTTAQASGATGSVLPSAKSRAALEVFAQAGSIEQLDAQQVNMKNLLRDLLDWSNKPGEATRANGNVVKAAATALQTRDENGVSRYPQAVEMLGFAAAVAPLLQPDRIGRLIAEGPKVDTAFAPDRYTMRFASAAKTILERYQEQRREELLVSLWHSMHAGRFWDITSGVTRLDPQAVRRRRRNPEERAAQEAAIREALAGHNVGTPEANAAITRALAEETLTYNAGTADLLRAVEPTQELRDELRATAEKMRAGEPVHPDKVVLISHIPWATVDERPESPAAWIMRQMASALRPDPETGQVLLEELPKKPRTWTELFPPADLAGFPHPPIVRPLDGRPLPGADGVLVEVVKNAAELQENREYMGNCTWSYKSQMEAGGYVLLKLFHGDERYNASITAHRVGDTWRVGEINSRYNRGQVPQFIRTAVENIAAQFPPRQEVARRTEATRKGAFRAAD